MRDIEVSDEVWAQIAAKGKFGETEDDVLRRVFGLSAANRHPSSATRPKGSRKRFATMRISASVQNDLLVVAFKNGERRSWKLPKKDNKDAIRSLRDEAVKFALSQGASDPGQTNAVRKALTVNGYRLIR